LPLVGGVFAMYGLKKTNLMYFLISSSLCIIGGVLIFCEGAIFRSVNNLSDYSSVSLLFGAIMGGITAVLAGVIGLGSIEIIKK
jgi:hypothetical protein